ncbi:MAG: hypothetical protein R3C03_12530 [Pirellulaceae bacterium]
MDVVGEWAVKKLLFQGEAMEGPGQPDKMVFSESVLNTTADGETIPQFSNLRFQIRKTESENQFEIDLVRGKDTNAETLPCLMKLEEGRLWIAMPMIQLQRDPTEPIARPENFDTAEKPIIVFEMKRL